MNVNELLQQSGISHAVYLERYKTSEVRSLIELLNTADKDLVAEIAKRSGDSITKQRLKALLRDIRRINSEAMGKLGKSLEKDMEELAVYEAGFQAKKVTEYIPIEWNITQPAPATLRAAILDRPFESGLLSQHVTNIEGRRLQQVEGAIRTGLVEGESIDQITRRIRGTRAQQYADGILEASRREVEALVRTAVNHTVSTARGVLYQQNPDLIKGIQYVATLDSRTTLICASLDGKVFSMNEGPRPPQHWRCRSTTIPVLKSWRELGIDMDEVPAGTRASMNGQVPAKTTFPDWLKGQPERVQIEVLGQKRWELWKNGAAIEKFVSDGRVLSLQEACRA
ncbi:minor capsid protein [Marispirochaeta aestuarii]|uniref:phage head morphogenesis protein n=1 Tax=Marispirochaeta aestuarii TaxID=1963862 RepID=UPI002ABDBBB2|nr:minor capsid protein [Marispirochaeta aestuarii]